MGYFKKFVFGFGLFVFWALLPVLAKAACFEDTHLNVSANFGATRFGMWDGIDVGCSRYKAALYIQDNKFGGAPDFYAIMYVYDSGSASSGSLTSESITNSSASMTGSMVYQTRRMALKNQTALSDFTMSVEVTPVGQVWHIQIQSARTLSNGVDYTATGNEISGNNVFIPY